VCATYSLRSDLRQADVIKLALLDHLIQRFGVLLDLVVSVAPCGLEQIEPLRPAQGLEDRIDAPAQVLPAPVRFQLSGERPAFNGEERAVCVSGVFLEEARDQLEIRCACALPVELA